MLPCVSNHPACSAKRETKYPDEQFAQAMHGERFLLFDGAMGTLLAARGVETSPVHVQDFLNLENPALVTELLAEYVAAGCDIVTTNTFRSNADILAGEATVAEVYAAAARCARESGARYVAAEIGPTGRMFAPYGDLTFPHVQELFAEQARAAATAGCDLVLVETMTDLLEAKAAVLAVKEETELPVFACLSFGENGCTMMGTTPAVAARALAALGADAIGVNCSVGPDLLLDVVEEMLSACSVPVIAQPNAGLPVIVDGVTGYDMTPERFVAAYEPMVDAGVTVLGSCCGTTPAYTAALRLLSARKAPHRPAADAADHVVGTRLSFPLSSELLDTAVTIDSAGAFDALSVSSAFFATMDADARLYSLDVTGADEDTATGAVMGLQAVCTAPLWFSSEDERAVEAAVRACVGVPVIGRRGQEHSACLKAVARHYGCILA